MKQKEPKIAQAVILKGCLRCKGDLAWQDGEWKCLMCSRVRKDV